MAEAVEAALRDEKHLLVEAGTGTGKTLAYLVPAVLSGRRVVVSTATKALQEQIFLKDIPLVKEVLARHGISFRAALMKGLSNYLCKRRYQELLATGMVDPMLPRLAVLDRDSETGDHAELEGLREDAELWREVSSSTDTRIGQDCRYFDDCFVTQMRKRAEDAEIVVVNHHLFLADLALRSAHKGHATAIPSYDAVVFDEAHQLEDIATDFFGVRASTTRVEVLLRDAERTLAAEKRLTKQDGARALLHQAMEAARRFFGSLGQETQRSTDMRRPLRPEDFTPAVLEAFGSLEARLRAIEAYAGQGGSEAVALIARRAGDLRTDLTEVVRGNDASEERHHGPRVVWIEHRDRSVSIGASPIDLGPTLRERLFDRVATVVCTSATLATGGGFHFAKARLGAPPEVNELLVPSPFDYASRAALYLPRDLPEPADPTFDAASASRIRELVALTDGGAFVLCTSTRAMRSIHASLVGHVGELLVQGERPKHAILSRFRASGHAVLVATMSFWEGVDVPGRALRLVILDKLPFAVPTDPVVAARAAQIEEGGGNSFVQYSVPAAAITLKQGFGRLVRSQRDGGIVAILDRRIVTRPYGRVLVASLPPARRLTTLDQVRAFWEELAPTLV
jgi:ATP-dependent DNA helicase DinG